MKVYIERVSHCGDDTKNPPTDFVQLTEEKRIDEEGHYASEWYCETDDLGGLLVGLEANEDSRLVFGVVDGIAHITIYDDYME